MACDSYCGDEEENFLGKSLNTLFYAIDFPVIWLHMNNCREMINIFVLCLLSGHLHILYNSHLGQILLLIRRVSAVLSCLMQYEKGPPVPHDQTGHNNRW